MTLTQLLADLRRNPDFMMNVMAWRTLPAVAATYETVPETLHPALQSALRQRTITQLYSHQAASIAATLAGENVVVVTPTASGKTLCYNLPILDTLLRDPMARALYLFPTKALAHDQLHELAAWEGIINNQLLIDNGQVTLRCSSYDGDTPAAARAQIRKESRLILSNPDMLHMGILPYHTAWEGFFGNLRYVVLDELHSYRGIFGSHVANVLRRLQRVCRLYGSNPQFICASATIANPQALAERLIEQPVSVITKNGAPRGEKQIILYNPPLYDAEHGLRRSSVLEAQELATRMLRAGLQTIVFGRSRLTTEVLLTYLRERMASADRQAVGDNQTPQSPIPNPQSLLLTSQSPIPNPQSLIRGYRGGYLPNERRAIEAGLRDGTVRGVVATNALELGIDIGGLQAAVLCGYPGSIAGTWQQMGRAGRTDEGSLAILVATGGLLDQYVIQHADYIFAKSPEHALINPDNLLLLIDHLRAAAFELPFQPNEDFGNCPFTADALQLLVEQGDVQRHGGRLFWSGESYPARQVSLRSAGGEMVAIQVEGHVDDDRRLSLSKPPVDDDRRLSLSKPPVDNHQPAMDQSHADIDFYQESPSTDESVIMPSAVRVIGQIDRAGALLLLHEGAIYLHEGRSYHVRQLDLENNQATVAPTAVDYYTEVTTETEIEVLAEHEQRAEVGARVAHGELLVSAQVVGYRRVKHFTHENLGVFPLEYPPQTLETSGYWFSLLPAAQLQLATQGQWFDSVNDYGPNWQAQRQRVRARDGYRCTQCKRPEVPDRQHDVHHLVPFRTFGYTAGLNEHYLEANRLSNLVLVCRTCHRRLEAGVRVRSGLDGLAYALTNIAPLHLMCDPQDLGVHVVRGEMAGQDDRMTRRQDDEETVDHSQFAIRNSQLPTIYLYERIAAGLGFSARLYELHSELLPAAAALIRACPCELGCPACVGPVFEGNEVQLETKGLTLALLDLLTAG